LPLAEKIMTEQGALNLTEAKLREALKSLLRQPFTRDPYIHVMLV
jgi:uncharacterized protein (DUF1778 family)